MAETKKQKSYQFRAKLPLIVRGAAVLGMLGALLAIGIGFYKARNNETFRMKGFPTQLSKDVVGVINGYERRESQDGVVKYFIKADKATTFADEHQELENVFLQIFDEEDQDLTDKISSNKAVYIPAGDGSKNFTIYFAGEVDIETRDALKVKTEQLKYVKETEIADAEELVKFSRQNISGSSYGAIVNIKAKTLDLLKDVEIDSYSGDSDGELAKTNIRHAKLKSGRAFIDQIAEKIKLEGGVDISLTPKSGNNGNLNQPTDIKSNSAIAYFQQKEIRKIDLKGNVDVHQKPTANNPGWMKTRANRAVASVNQGLTKLELYENVQIETLRDDSKPTKIRAGKAVYDKTSDTFDLENDVEIITVEEAKATRINASKALYEQTNRKVSLYGNAAVYQGEDVVKGDTLEAELFPNKKLKFARATGNAFLRQKTNDRMTEIEADELNATFGANQLIQDANTLGRSNVVIIPANSKEYKRFALFAPKSIKLDFRADGTLSELKTDGRTTIKLSAPNNAPDSANKELTADSIETKLRANGKELANATATGNAELVVVPLRSSSENYKTVVNAPNFDCDFYEGNNAKNCSAKGSSRVSRTPTSGGKSKQTLTANALNAVFDKNNQDVERFEASGKAKFVEGDRNGIADRIVYSANDQVVRLRGGEPTVWDSQARAKANEIDWNVGDDKSQLRGNASTTYYSQKQTSGAAPFTAVNSPVFVTAENANFDHNKETALFSGNARAWQGDNYVRAERLLLEQKAGQLFAEGKVQSKLYDASRTIGGKKSKIPVFASAGKMLFRQKENLLRYEDDVDIRQGTDRIEAGVANVYLDKSNDLQRTVIENNVVITQPNRRASGNYAEYDAINESVVLRGSPARVTDDENGSSSGREVSVDLKTNRVIGKGSTTKKSTGRIRTVYKIKNGKIN